MLISSQECVSFQLPSPKHLSSRLKLLSNSPKRKSPQAPHLPLLSTYFFFLFLFGKTLSTIFPSKKRLFFLRKILFFFVSQMSLSSVNSFFSCKLLSPLFYSNRRPPSALSPPRPTSDSFLFQAILSSR